MKLPPRPVRVLLVVLLALGAAAVVVALLRGGGEEDVVLASGTVEATDADLGFEIPGRIASVEVREGDRVDAGQTLARLDRTELDAGLRSASARAEAARARLRELEAGSRPEEIGQGRAAVRAAESRLANAENELERARPLFAAGAYSRQKIDALQTARDVAAADAETARERLRLLEKGPRSEQIEAARAALQAAEAEVGTIEAKIWFSEARAAFGGIVTVRHREPGETVAPGLPVLTVMDPTDRWVRIYVPENEVGKLRLGGPARITADAYPDRTYRGKIVHVASEAEFTPRNVQTTEERVKLVYEVRVRVMDDQELELKPGLPADVRVEVDAS
jgi:HlyD family secretion protein